MFKTAKYIDSTKKHLALIAPLDWGLGHTIRCIPIIRELKKHNIKIIIACNSVQKSVLEPEFPGETFLHLDGYGLSYGKSRFLTLAKLFLQIPKILISIKRENLQLKRILTQFNPDFIISDNRYGFVSSTVRSIIITHQFNLVTGAGKICDRFASLFVRKQLKRFDACWVPDLESEPRLAGKLSRLPQGLKIPVTYIGPLSRLETCDTADTSSGYILAVLSGPEPQRTKFEDLLLDQLEQLAETGLQVILVRGLPQPGQQIRGTKNIRIIGFAGSAELNQLICNAAVVICRAGYTSVMDLVKLRKKSILVPTPGQGEQEYLGRHLASERLAVVSKQGELNLQEALAMTGSIRLLETGMELYRDVIAETAQQATYSDVKFTGF